MESQLKVKNVMELTSCLDALITMNDLCLAKSVFDWETITQNMMVSTLFEECDDSPGRAISLMPYHLNQIVYSEKKAKNQLLNTILYQALKPVYADIDGSGDYSLDPLDLPHIEILFMDNSGDFSYETLKNLINNDLTTIFKENKQIQSLEILELTCKILDKILIQPSYSVKEFLYNLKKCNIYVKRHPAIRLVVIDSVNTFFQNDFFHYVSSFNSTEPPKKSNLKRNSGESLALREIVKLSHHNNLKVLFTTMEYYTKKALKFESGHLVLEEQINKYLNFGCNDQLDMGISSLYLINPSMHGDIMKKYLIAIEVEETEDKEKDPDCILAINKRNNVHDFFVRAIKIENGAPSFTPAKKALVKGAFFDSFGPDDPQL